MRTQFLHLSDVHLGYQQYGHRDRFNDFGRAFLSTVDYAVQQQVNLVLISGDLFHKSAIDPPTLLQAVTGLERLHQVGCSVVAIAGNHDGARYYDRFSWLGYLAERGYLASLSPIVETGIDLLPWDGSVGAYVDIDGVRVYGVPYLGASVRRVLVELPDMLAGHNREGIEFTILMGHFGLEGEIRGVPGGLPLTEVSRLREYVDYLALGHWHKPFEREGWIFNPGSLETCGMDERNWQGGFYHVAVDTAREPKHIANHVPCNRRPFYRLLFPVGSYGTPESLYDGLRTRLKEESSAMRSGILAPVVEVSLEGILAFDRGALDIEYIRELIEEAVSPLIARPRNNTHATEFEVPSDERLSRIDLENQIFQNLIQRDSRYRDHTDLWVSLISEAKTMTLTGSPPEAIVETVRQHVTEMSGE